MANIPGWNQELAQWALSELIFSAAVLFILIACLRSQARHPEIRQFGWGKIVWGCGFLLFGSMVDIIDDPPVQELIVGSWGWRLLTAGPELAIVEKIGGFTTGFVLIAIGFNQWVPWMVSTRQKLSAANQNLSRTLMSLDEHVENVRLTISRELHDDIAQALTSLGFQLQLTQKQVDADPESAKTQIKGINTELSETLKSVRQLARDMRPEALFALGLVPAMEQFLEKMRVQNPDTEIIFGHDWLDEENPQRHRLEGMLDEDRLLHLFRVLQEGVRNALKHAQAKSIRIAMREESARFVFEIEDDGKGLPWPQIPPDEQLIQEGHLGLVGLRERVRELNGTFELGRREHGGAHMEVSIPK